MHLGIVPAEEPAPADVDALILRLLEQAGHDGLTRASLRAAYYGASRSRVRSHPDQQSEVMPITIPD
jgi:hypothetical protein